MRISILTVCALAFFVPASPAATTLGQTFNPVQSMLPTPVAFQSAVDGYPSYAAPSAGILTSFSHIAEASPDATLSLIVLRPIGVNYSVVAVSEPKTLVGGAMNTFPARIPVLAGDIIGVQGDTWNLGAASPAATMASTFRATATPVSAGGTILSGVIGDFNGYILDISATLEADADGDGFGDETQDLCPTQATTQGACDLTGPTLTVKASKTQQSKSSLKLTATSNEAGTCKISTKLVYTTTKNGKRVKKTIKLKSSTRTFTAGTKQSITLKLSSKAKSALKSAGSLKATVTIACTDGLNNKSTKTVKITVKGS